MSLTNDPHLGIYFDWKYRTDEWKEENDFNLRTLAALSQLAVIDEVNSPPGSPSNGDRYLVGSSPSGDFSGHAGEIAIYWDDLGSEWPNHTNGWEFHTPQEGWTCYFKHTSTLNLYDGSSWVAV